MKVCELSRLIATHRDLRKYPTLFIRFNIGSYEIGKVLKTGYKSRISFLYEYLVSLENVISLNYSMLVTYLFYDEYEQPEYYTYSSDTKTQEKTENAFMKY